MKHLALIALAALVPSGASAQVCEVVVHDGPGLSAAADAAVEGEDHWLGARGSAVFEGGAALSMSYGMLVRDRAHQPVQRAGVSVRAAHAASDRFALCGGLGLYRGWLDGLAHSGPARSSDPCPCSRDEFLVQRTLSIPVTVGGAWRVTRLREGFGLALFAEASGAPRYVTVRRPFVGAAPEREASLNWNGSIGGIATLGQFVFTPTLTRTFRRDSDVALGFGVGMRF